MKLTEKMKIALFGQQSPQMRAINNFIENNASQIFEGPKVYSWDIICPPDCKCTIGCINCHRRNELVYGYKGREEYKIKISDNNSTYEISAAYVARLATPYKKALPAEQESDLDISLRTWQISRKCKRMPAPITIDKNFFHQGKGVRAQSAYIVHVWQFMPGMKNDGVFYLPGSDIGLKPTTVIPDMKSIRFDNDADAEQLFFKMRKLYKKQEKQR